MENSSLFLVTQRNKHNSPEWKTDMSQSKLGRLSILDSSFFPFSLPFFLFLFPFPPSLFSFLPHFVFFFLLNLALKFKPEPILDSLNISYFWNV